METEREKLIKEMEIDASIIAKIIEEFKPEVPFEIVDTGGRKFGVLRDLPYMEDNPKITKKLIDMISKKTGYVPHDIREVGPEGEKALMLIKDLGGKFGKSIALGHDTLYMGVLIFDDR